MSVHGGMSASGEVDAELFCWCEILPKEKASSPLPSLIPIREEVVVHVTVIGCRQLKPYQMIKITKPFLEIEAQVNQKEIPFAC